jgi:hypothetical protein
MDFLTGQKGPLTLFAFKQPQNPKHGYTTVPQVQVDDIDDGVGGGGRETRELTAHSIDIHSFGDMVLEDETIYFV